MEMDAGFVFLVGIGCFLLPFVFFAAFRTVNRTVVLLLSISFACFAVAMGAVVWENYQQGMGHLPSDLGTASTISRENHPALFFLSTMFLFACVAGLASMALYLLRIAVMRRRRRA